MSLYVLGDPHLSLGSEKPMDIFSGWDGYVSLLEENWKKTVQPQDTILLAGDISWALKLEETKADFDFLEALPGKKILLKGNHDLWWSTKSKVERFWTQQGYTSFSLLFNNAYEYGDYCLCGSRGWINEPGVPQDKKILDREAGRLRMSLEAGRQTGKQPIVFLHYPPVYASLRCDEIMEVLLEYGVKRCYYGHLHGRDTFRGAVNGAREGIAFTLISADYLRFQPKLVEP